VTARLGIGTAQFGLDYGISNARGQCPPEEVARILDFAREAGVHTIDTAALYGGAEEALGRSLPRAHPFAIVTKTPPFAPEGAADDHVEILESTFQRSLDRLRQDRIYALLAHRADDLLGPAGGRLIEAMLRLKDSGRVAKVGASVYDGRQVDALLARHPIDVVQLPLSILDQRLVRGGQVARLKAAGVEVHVRSIFLQGLLLMDVSRLPPYFERFRPRLEAYHARARESGLTPLQAALSFVLRVEGVDTVIVGVASLEDLRQIVASAPADLGPALGFSDLACADEDLVNPSRWPPIPTAKAR